MPSRLGSLLVLPLLSLTASQTPATSHLPPHRSSAPRVVVNDNRVAGGVLTDGVLTLHLEATDGGWHPDAEDAPGTVVHAFAEAGGPPRVPGPLIRVPEGTEIRATVRNTLAEPLVVHGLHARGGAVPPGADTIGVAPGATREVTFRAGAPGTYYYWGTTLGAKSWQQPRPGYDTQLYGAFVVDPAGAPATPRDRILVIGVWTDSAIRVLSDATPNVMRMVINGKSWPNTERLAYTAGDTIRWRLVNTSTMPHPMHLHGFYFRVTSRGDGERDSVYAPDAPSELAVTERMVPGSTFSLEWVPDRIGYWLFHCHDNVHIRVQKPLPGAPARVAERAAPMRDHKVEDMAGLVMGIQVRPRPGTQATTEPTPRRRIRLVERPDTGGTPQHPAYTVFLDDGSGNPPPGAPSLPAPPIVLTRGDPVAITVANELPVATSVHWHGIELESYYDGVPGFDGTPGRIAPAIAARDSFVARFTPPRAGTFIYHTHMDDLRQQRAGLAGAIIVLPPGQAYDPATDLVFIVTTPRREADAGVVLLNGSTAPAPIELRAGTRYRLRLINIHTYRPSLRFQLRRDTTILSWRALAKDGAALPPELATARRADQFMGMGETYDFELVPAEPGDLRFEIRTAPGKLLTEMVLRVR